MKKRLSGAFSNTGGRDMLTYSSINKKKSAFVNQGGQSLVEGFTPRQQAEFDEGITVENYAKSRDIIL